jgi:ubiquinone/menaquinone biosynthesis C-methylase UbiE
MSIDNLVFEYKYKKGGFESQRRYPNESLIQFLAAHYFSVSKKLRKNIKILEVGCGSGANLWMIAREGFSAYGQDISPTGIKLCRETLRSYGVTAKLSTGNFKELDYPDIFFDVIVDVVSLQHTNIVGHSESYAEIYRCLKPGGRFFSWHLGDKSISFKESGGRHIDQLTVDVVRNRNVPLSNNGPSCFLNFGVTKKLLKKAGFVHTTIERSTRTYRNMSQVIEYLNIQAEKGQPIKDKGIK